MAIELVAVICLLAQIVDLFNMTSNGWSIPSTPKNIGLDVYDVIYLPISTRLINYFKLN